MAQRRSHSALEAIAELRTALGEPRDEPNDDAAVARLVAFFERAIRMGQVTVEPKPPVSATPASPAKIVDLANLADLAEPPSASTETRGEPPAETDPATWFEVEVVDDLGQPVEGLDLVFESVVGSEFLTTGADGVSRLEPALGSRAVARLASLAAVRDAVFPRWSQPREGTRPVGDDTVELIVRDPLTSVTLPPQQRITIVLVPHIIRLRLTGMYFDNAKAFLLPDAMHGITKLRDIYDEIPDAQLLIVGHTNSVGDTAYNDQLSLERSDSISAFVRDDVDAWHAFYGPNVSWEKRWGQTEDRHMLGALPPGAGPDDVYLRGGLLASYQRFQRARGLPETGTGDPATRKALIAEYMAHDRTSLPPSATVVTHGCGEHFSDVEPGHDEKNRRVEIFVFDGPITPPPQGALSGPDATDYPAWRAQTIRTFDVATGESTVATASVWIRLELSAADAPASSDRLTLRGSDGYTQQLEVATAHVPSGVAAEAVDLEFTEAPMDGVYTLTVESDAGAYDLFSDVPFGALPGLGLGPQLDDDVPDDDPPATTVAGIEQPLDAAVA